MSVERMGPAWAKRFHEQSLRGLGVTFWEEKERLIVFRKNGLIRKGEKDDPEWLMNVLTNDLELNKETALEILELVAAKTSVAGREVF